MTRSDDVTDHNIIFSKGYDLKEELVFPPGVKDGLTFLDKCLLISLFSSCSSRSFRAAGRDTKEHHTPRTSVFLPAMASRATHVWGCSSVPAPLLSAFGSTAWKEAKHLFQESYFYDFNVCVSSDGYRGRDHTFWEPWVKETKGWKDQQWGENKRRRRAEPKEDRSHFDGWATIIKCSNGNNRKVCTQWTGSVQRLNV